VSRTSAEREKAVYFHTFPGKIQQRLYAGKMGLDNKIALWYNTQALNGCINIAE